MRTRDKISDDHNHPDQTNYDPTTPGGVQLDKTSLQVAPQHADRLQRLRDAWAARIPVQ